MVYLKYLNSSLFNIGFCELTPNHLIATQKLPSVRWMKHPYKDRFFADPFILDVTDSEIICLAEECEFTGKGVISRLIIDRKNYELKRKDVLLSLDTHLSYPAYIKQDGKVYVYPENSQSHTLKMYIYNSQNSCLDFVQEIHNEGLIDATMVQYIDSFYLFACNSNDHQFKHLYQYKSSNFRGPFEKVGDSPIAFDIASSRPAGNFFKIGNNFYRVAQNCKGRYGKAVAILKINKFEPYDERLCFYLKPKSLKYSLRLHTLNFHKSGLCTIDGCGYLYPILGRILVPMYNFALRYIKGINYFK